MTSAHAHPRVITSPPEVPLVPFVELFDGRLQGIVAASGVLDRVHVTLVEAHTGNWACSTGHQPCPHTLEGTAPCAHVRALVASAVEDFGAERIAHFLGHPELRREPWRLVSELVGTSIDDDGTAVFVRFLDYLRYVQLPSGVQPPSGLVWFSSR
ncbi:MAG: hypothetical protein AAF211_02095 [Myxococcota bacterium]